MEQCVSIYLWYIFTITIIKECKPIPFKRYVEKSCRSLPNRWNWTSHSPDRHCIISRRIKSVHCHYILLSVDLDRIWISVILQIITVVIFLIFLLRDIYIYILYISLNSQWQCRFCRLCRICRACLITFIISCLVTLHCGSRSYCLASAQLVQLALKSVVFDSQTYDQRKQDYWHGINHHPLYVVPFLLIFIIIVVVVHISHFFLYIISG